MHVRRRLPGFVALLLGLLGSALVAPTATAAAGSDVLRPGEILRAGEGLTVPAGRLEADFELDMQGDGNLVLYHDLGDLRLAAWSSRTDGNPGAHAVMQGDGNLVVYAADGRPLWHTLTNGWAGASLRLQDDGNLVLYSGSRPLWHTHTYVLIDSLVTDERLLPGQDLVSADERYRFVMQGDGNVVGYGPNGRPFWWTGTHGHPGASLVLQGDGNLVLYDADGRTPLWWTRTEGTEAELLLLWPGGTLTLLGGPDLTVFWMVPGLEPIPDGDI